MKTSRRPMRPETEMFKTVCDTCHKPCEVPFRPNGKKPVFCDACFNKNREITTNDYIQRKDKMVFDGPEIKNPNARVDYHPTVATTLPDAKFLELKREINSVNAKLDKLVDLVSKLSPKKVSKKEE